MYIDEILDHFKCGKKIRRTSWSSCFYLDKKEDDFYLSADDLLADDWEVIETKKEKTWWKPKVGESYWSIRPWSGAVRVCYNDDKVDGFAVSMGLCFQTEEQAEFMVEKLRVIHELEKFAYENNEEEIDWNDTNQEKLYLTMNYMDKCIDVFYTYAWIYSPSNIYFTSKKIAKEAIETIGEDRIKKYYFGVEKE